MSSGDVNIEFKIYSTMRNKMALSGSKQRVAVAAQDAPQDSIRKDRSIRQFRSPHIEQSVVL